MSFFSRLMILGIIISAAAILAACSKGSDENTNDTIEVVTSLPLFADMVQEVGGDRVEVRALLPSGADPHTYEPAPRDVVAVTEADVAFVNGLSLEPNALKVIKGNLGEAVPLVELAAESNVEIHESEDEPGHAHSEGDPHLWMNPDNAIAYAVVIRDQLTSLDPEGAETYEANFDAYKSEIEAVGSHLQATAAAVPESNRRLITTHDAFGYLADFLGFEITAFVAAGPGQEASPEDIRAIVEAINEEGVRAVFTEPQVSGESKVLEQAAADAGAIVCTLYSDSLDDRVTTYLDMMRFNAGEIARCLGGENGG